MKFIWTITLNGNTIGDLKEKKSDFLKAVKGFNQRKIGVSVPMLMNNKESVFADTQNEYF